MTYTLAEFCEDVREAFAARDDHKGRDQFRQHLERLLADALFRAGHVGAGRAR